MAVTAELLQELHRIHQQLADLNERLERGPRQIRAREANLAKAKQELADEQEQIKKAKLIGDQKQLDLQAGENKIEDYKAKLNASSSNKEFHAFQEQIAAAQMANSVHADEILETLEKIDKLEVAIKETESKVAAGEEDLAKFREETAKQAVLIHDDIKRLEGDLAAAEKQLVGDFREDYNRVIRNMGADGMSSAEGRICTGCGQQMTLNMQNELLLSKPIFCKACGRMLYIAE